ncbi:hypothetical protein PIB30_105926 [Stylosanthes scabra]|uniref:Uncharacterized protein n=1 Tax=Stylosanthes scabra TaxID=79078 RepID=A0ABU6QY60_9FABA|nr:hypothetical protein [Stylosanthes scabra]
MKSITFINIRFVKLVRLPRLGALWRGAQRRRCHCGGEDDADDSGVREGLMDLQGLAASVEEDGGYAFTLQRLHEDVCALAGLADGGRMAVDGVVAAEGSCGSVLSEMNFDDWTK